MVYGYRSWLNSLSAQEEHILISKKTSRISSSEKVCLKWNDFQGNINTSFQEMRHDQYFSDVTLAYEDKQKIEAHKVILVASSQVFRELLKDTKSSHPLLYMRGIKVKCLNG